MRKPWLLLPAKLAHDVAPLGLALAAKFRPLKTPAYRPIAWRGLEFKNPLGIAGGVDKNATQIENWWRMGAGFVEVGTVTPEPQGPNPGQIVDREISRHAVWNRMGFPNEGAAQVHARLQQLAKPHFTPVFVNIGKNRNTELENAHKDYAGLIESFSETADAFVINISSPNTAGLRDLFAPKALENFLQKTLSANRKRLPCLLKLSPDLSLDELRRVLDVSLAAGIDGWILTNTSREIRDGLPFSAEGGVSGRPLASRSRECLITAVEHLGPRRQDRLIISAGGVLSPLDVEDRLALGANLVQVYAALIFEGPWFFSNVIRELNS